ncbi:hypothetical protein MRX96_027651 [Rhipicephalus microplus]
MAAFPGSQQQQGVAMADGPAATDGNLGRKDSLVVLRKRMHDKEVHEPTNININTVLGVAATLLLTVLLIGYIVGLQHGVHRRPDQSEQADTSGEDEAFPRTEHRLHHEPIQ